MMRFLIIPILLFSASFSYVLANLMAVDLGLGYVKVAVARPGKGLELVTNEQSKRKTPAAVGFTDEGERLFGDAAIAYSAKAPNRAILDGRQYIGKCLPDPSESNPLGSPLCPRDRLELEGVGKFTGEEIVAMLLGMARKQASAALGGAVVKDVAITVPAWYDERQRLAIADAARVIGLNCLGVVNANTAAAIKYALDGKAKPTEDMIKTEKEKDKKKRQPKTITQTVLFYDLGAGGASASIAKIVSDVKTGIANSVKMLAHAWETGVSGRLLDTVVVERLADAFDKQRGAGAKPSRDIPRVMMRLRKEAQRAREVLSANSDTMVSVASLYDDLDLRTVLKRADFEADAESMLNLVGGPVKQVLSDANLKTDDLDAVVPFGGTSRTPRVQQEILNALGIASLNKSINTDEAAVMGCSFYGASLSSTFRVRKLDFEDVYSRSISVEVEKEGKSGLFSGGKKATQTVVLFPEGSGKMPSKKTMSLNRNSDFVVKVYLGMDKSGKARFPEKTLYANIKISGVTDVLKKLKDTSKAKSLTPRVALTFHVDRSGLIGIGIAESSVDETVVVEREVEVIEDKKNKTDDNKSKDEKKQEKKDEASPSAEESANPSAEESPEKSDETKDEKAKDKKKKKKTKIEKSTQTVVHRQTLKVEFLDNEGIVGMIMSGKELEEAKNTLKALELADKERVERADALNALEGFILEVRSTVRGLDEDDDLYKVSTEEEREKIVSAFNDAEDWMYTEDAKKLTNLRKKLTEVKGMYRPMASRAYEMVERPKAFDMILELCKIATEEGAKMKKLHVERNSNHVEAFDKFDESCSAAVAWVAEKKVEQEKKAPTETPAISLSDIDKKIAVLRKAVEKLAKLVPPPPKESPKETPKADEKEETDQNSTTTDDKGPSGDDVTSDDTLGGDADAEAAKADAASSTGTKEEL